MKILNRTLLLIGALAASSLAVAAGPGTYLGMGTNSTPGGNTTTQTIGGAGGPSVGSNQATPSPNSRALETANGQFSDRQFGIERAQQSLSLSAIEQQRAGETLELRSSRLGSTQVIPTTPGTPAPATASAPTTPVTPTEAPGAIVTR
jgi:hypothetical protein